MSTGPELVFMSSTYSSLPPAGPRKRNSEITTPFDDVKAGAAPARTTTAKARPTMDRRIPTLLSPLIACQRAARSRRPDDHSVAFGEDKWPHELACRRAQLPRHDVRLPDERPRLRADQGHARGARPRRGARAGRGRRARLQHLHDPGEARPALRRAPRPGESAEGTR